MCIGGCCVVWCAGVLYSMCYLARMGPMPTRACTCAHSFNHARILVFRDAADADGCRDERVMGMVVCGVVLVAVCVGIQQSVNRRIARARGCFSSSQGLQPLGRTERLDRFHDFATSPRRSVHLKRAKALRWIALARA